MDEILFLSAPLKERIWGGDFFKNTLHVTESNEKIGEMWTCSAHKAGESIILNGTYKNQTLSEVFKNHKELFNNTQLYLFPILIKLIATNDDLSVQVHPDDEYAKIHENDSGKTEGWLILDCKEDSKIVVGHNAKNKEELTKMIENDEYDKLLNYRNVKKGEFYPIYSGTIHALGKDLLILEIQQSSDVTYRVYDYHRKDKNGNERELHVKKAIDVTNYLKYDSKIINCLDDNVKTIWKNNYFNVDLATINKELTIKNNNHDYLICSVISGNIVVDNRPLILGESFIITSNAKEITLLGNGKITITKYNK